MSGEVPEFIVMEAQLPGIVSVACTCLKRCILIVYGNKINHIFPFKAHFVALTATLLCFDFDNDIVVQDLELVHSLL